MKFNIKYFIIKKVIACVRQKKKRFRKRLTEYYFFSLKNRCPLFGSRFRDGQKLEELLPEDGRLGRSCPAVAYFWQLCIRKLFKFSSLFNLVERRNLVHQSTK